VGQTLLRGSDRIPADYQAGKLSGKIVELVDVKNSPYMWFPNPGLNLNFGKKTQSIRQNLSIDLVGPIQNVAIVLAKLNSANQVISWNLRWVHDRTSTNVQNLVCNFTAVALPIAVDALSISSTSLDMISHVTALIPESNFIEGISAQTGLAATFGSLAVNSVANATGASQASNEGPYKQPTAAETVQTLVDVRLAIGEKMTKEKEDLVRMHISQYENLIEKSSNHKIQAIAVGKLPLTKDALSSLEKFDKYIKLATNASVGVNYINIRSTYTQTVEEGQKMWRSIFNTPSAIASNQQNCNG
jgi:hypothetical protein